MGSRLPGAGLGLSLADRAPPACVYVCAVQPRFSVLSEADILQRQSEAVRDVATVLSVDPSEASILLRHFKWCVIVGVHKGPCNLSRGSTSSPSCVHPCSMRTRSSCMPVKADPLSLS